MLEDDDYDDAMDAHDDTAPIKARIRDLAQQFLELQYPTTARGV